MVQLNRIYTRSGDSGETGLGDGTRVSKTNIRIHAIGAVDELNSMIGVAVAAGLPEKISDWLRRVQNDLFDAGADLCVPPKPDEDQSILRLNPEAINQLEQWIDRVNESLEPLNSFILPGGSVAAAGMHAARSVCRRAELTVLELVQTQDGHRIVARYLNRLSDLLFVLARLCNDGGTSDILWIPGNQR